MNNILLFILSLIGLLALYWALIGQWRWNKMIRQSEEKEKVGKDGKDKSDNI
ncbi:MAG TPA: hypothetical protein VFF28_03420 [Candidatus Nanoarchaeia archaeon]|nr:hypothetical protein [Candidatus Nanoarchaeia archaeon]